MITNHRSSTPPLPMCVLLISTLYINLIYPYFPTSHSLFAHGLVSSKHTQRKPNHTKHFIMAYGGEDHNPYREIPYDSSSGGASLPTRPTSELFRRKKIRAKKNKKSMDPTGRPVTEEHIIHHVASKYVTGPGGVLFTSEMKRKKMEDESTASTLFGMDPTESSYSDFLKKLDRHPALVLNANYQPLSILPLSLWHWQETIKTLFTGKVVVVDVYPDIFITAVNMKVPLPSVIALTDFVAQPDQKPAFTRRNVFLRDNYRCQYCGHYFLTENLSLDHVIPRCVGGKLEWQVFFIL